VSHVDAERVEEYVLEIEECVLDAVEKFESVTGYSSGELDRVNIVLTPVGDRSLLGPAMVESDIVRSLHARKVSWTPFVNAEDEYAIYARCDTGQMSSVSIAVDKDVGATVVRGGGALQQGVGLVLYKNPSSSSS
jgi:hypothetical protein